MWIMFLRYFSLLIVLLVIWFNEISIQVLRSDRYSLFWLNSALHVWSLFLFLVGMMQTLFLVKYFLLHAIVFIIFPNIINHHPNYQFEVVLKTIALLLLYFSSYISFNDFILWFLTAIINLMNTQLRLYKLFLYALHCLFLMADPE